MRRQLNMMLAAAALIAVSGCIQIDTKVKLHEDGSATITERLRVSKYLMDLDAQQKGGGPTFTQLLGKGDALRRMKEMGKGVTLISHKTQSAEGDSRECVVVYKIPDINNLVYMSPLLAHPNYPGINRVGFKLVPMMEAAYYGHWAAGQMNLKVYGMTSDGKLHERIGGPPRPKGAPPPGPSPSELQAYRDIAPVFRDIMKGFQVRLRVESYALIDRTTWGVRDRMANVKTVDLIDFTDEDLDRFGKKFVENEEVMLDVVRRDLDSQDIWASTRGFVGNRTLPVFLMLGSPYYQSSYKRMHILFAPSRPLFDKFFAGKQIDVDRAKGKQLVPADFNKIGWKGE